MSPEAVVGGNEDESKSGALVSTVWRVLWTGSILYTNLNQHLVIEAHKTLQNVGCISRSLLHAMAHVVSVALLRTVHT